MKIIIKKSDGGIAVMQLMGIAAEAADLAPEHIDTIVEAEVSAWASKEDSVDSQSAFTAEASALILFSDATLSLSLSSCASL